MIALMYHDVVEPDAADASGFPGKDAALYKVSPRLFEDHLRALAAARSDTASASSNGDSRKDADALAITFDDGGVSAMRAAEVLERYGLRGHFFVTANYIGTRGFVDRRDMRELVARGHVVGSHSCSHPLRMGHCAPAQLADEWTRSRDVISGIVGQAVTSASVPGGDFAWPVATAAAGAGFTELFTSEPTTSETRVDGLALRGRFTIRRWTSPATAAALATARALPCAQQIVAWNVRKFGKRVAGERYLRLRQWLLRQPADVAWGDSPERRPAGR